MSTPLKALIQERLRAKIVRQEVDEDGDGEAPPAVYTLQHVPPSLANTTPLIDASAYMVPSPLPRHATAHRLFHDEGGIASLVNSSSVSHAHEQDVAAYHRSLHTYRAQQQGHRQNQQQHHHDAGVTNDDDRLHELPSRSAAFVSNTSTAYASSKWRGRAFGEDNQHEAGNTLASRKRAVSSTTRETRRAIVRVVARSDGHHPRSPLPCSYYYDSEYDDYYRAPSERGLDANDNNYHDEQLYRHAAGEDADAYDDYDDLQSPPRTAYSRPRRRLLDSWTMPTKPQARAQRYADSHFSTGDLYANAQPPFYDDYRGDYATDAPRVHERSMLGSAIFDHSALSDAVCIPVRPRRAAVFPSPLDMATIATADRKLPDSRIGSASEQLSRIRVYDDILSPDSTVAAKAFVEKRQKRSSQGTPRTMATHRWLQSMVNARKEQHQGGSFVDADDIKSTHSPNSKPEFAAPEETQDVDGKSDAYTLALPGGVAKSARFGRRGSSSTAV